MNTAQHDRLNCLVAGLCTAIGAHALLCLAALPHLIAGASDGFVAVLIKVSIVVWTALGIPVAAFIAMKVAGAFNGRSYSDAKIGAIATTLLPLVGTPGSVTAFALIPAGLLASWLLRQPQWRTAFNDPYQNLPATVDPASQPVSVGESVFAEDGGSEV